MIYIVRDERQIDAHPAPSADRRKMTVFNMSSSSSSLFRHVSCNNINTLYYVPGIYIYIPTYYTGRGTKNVFVISSARSAPTHAHTLL